MMKYQIKVVLETNEKETVEHIANEITELISRLIITQGDVIATMESRDMNSAETSLNRPKPRPNF